MAAMEKSSRRKLEKSNPRKVVNIPAGRKSVVLGVTGSIAAYKSAELASLLVKQGHQIFVVMTHDAAEFISPLTLQTLSKTPVMTSFFDEKESSRRRIHRTGRRNAGVRIRRTRPFVESERDRVPCGISSYPPRQTDRVTFLITAGPTREPIDPVRYISNRSSGKMGYAIAEAALDAGQDVILISGPVNLSPPRHTKFISVSTSDEMFEAVHQLSLIHI